MNKKYTGHCACGQVRYGFDTEPTFIANCRCTDCKRASGGEMATFAAVPDMDFTVFTGNTKSFSYGPNTETVRARGSIASSVQTAVPGYSPTDLDAIIDCAGAPEMMQLGFSLLSISGHYADVGLVGDRIDIPLFPRVHREQTFHGSFWGNYTDLSEVMALAAENKIRHTIKVFGFDDINKQLELLRKGEVVGRAVMKF